jgi:hypothetical protein
VAWKFKAIQPGSNTIVTSASGTVTTATIGNVTEVFAAPNADITKTAMGHISVQYALIDLVKVSNALHGHHTEMGIDRFIRLANEQALDNATEFAERNNHWGFRDGTQGWAGTNGAVTQSTVFTSSQDTDSSGVWSFTVSGTPTFNNYFIVTTAQSASIPLMTGSPPTQDRPDIPGDASVGAVRRVRQLLLHPQRRRPISNPATVAGCPFAALTASGETPFAFSQSGTVSPSTRRHRSVHAKGVRPTALPNAYISVSSSTPPGPGSLKPRPPTCNRRQHRNDS